MDMSPQGPQLVIWLNIALVRVKIEHNQLAVEESIIAAAMEQLLILIIARC